MRHLIISVVRWLMILTNLYVCVPQNSYCESDTQQLPELNGQSTLCDYLRYAQYNNAALNASYKRWLAALHTVPQQTALPDPRVSYGYYFQEIETRVGPQRNRFGVSQTVPWIPKLDLKGKIALGDVAIARQQYISRKLELCYEVKSVFYDYVYLSHEIAILQENTALLEQIESIALTQYKAGKASYSDVLKTQIELEKLKDTLQSAKELRIPLQTRFNALLGRPSNEPIAFPVSVPQEYIPFTEEELYVAMIDANPQLGRLSELIDQQNQKKALAKQDFFPDVTLGLEYIDTGTARFSNVRDSGKDAVIGMVSVNVPVWWNKYHAGLREHENRSLGAEYDYADTRNRLEAELKIALYHFQDAERKTALYRDNLIPKAQQTLATTRQAYSGGSVNFFDLIDSYQALLEFKLSYEKEFTRKFKQLAQIEKLVGKQYLQLDAPCTTVNESKN